VSAAEPIFHETIGAVMADPTFPCSMATALDLVSLATEETA
jgi:hypothetical protein